MRLIHDYEADTADCEKETAGQSLHDVLSIDPVRHECHRSRVAVLIGCRSDAGRLHNDIIDDAYKQIIMN